MHDHDLTTSHPSDLLNALKSHRFLANYRLAVYSRRGGTGTGGPPQWDPLETTPSSFLCGTACIANLGQSLNTVIDNNRQRLFSCPAGLPAFAVPLASVATAPYCLVGCGVREHTLDLTSLQAVAAASDIDPLDFLVQLERLPVVTRGELEDVARKVSHLVPFRQPEKTQVAVTGETTERLHAIVGLSADIDGAEGADEAISLLAEALGVLFDIPGIAIAQPAEAGEDFLLRGAWGPPVEAALLSADELTRLFSRPSGATFLEEDRFEEIFPGVHAAGATCLPLTTGNELLGVVALLDTRLQADDLHLAELLVGRVALRLSQLKKDDEQKREAALSARFLSMLAALAVTEGAEELYRSILKMAAELVQATRGSLMFLDDAGETLRIEAALGMNLHVARSLRAKVGTGIAGKVAATGHPLLVHDIEKDSRLATQNRPRFKTHSFICLPLRIKGRTMGVLNLSDKENEGVYTERNLDILLPFLEHAAILVDRARNLERTELLERLSVTDALTELFNRRFLGKRLEEELNRAKRHGLQLTVMMIDLDNFKLYNDVHGHMAGDKVLKKTARILQASVRDMDVVTRYGGEEFCIVLPDTGKKQSLFAADRIRRGIEKASFPCDQGLPAGRVTASIGIASFPEDGDTASALIKAADTALYQAKGGGRNRIVFSSPCSLSDEAPLQPMLPVF